VQAIEDTTQGERHIPANRPSQGNRRTGTTWPDRCSSDAAVWPAIPAPTTRTSVVKAYCITHHQRELCSCS
jgi:hypothetical protein